jgi:hypothetical protein
METTLPPLAGEYTYGMPDMADCTMDLSPDSVGVFSADDVGGAMNPQRDQFPTPPP